MGLPSKKRTPRSKKDRNSHSALKQTKTVACSACGKSKLPHHACPHCGAYRGRTAKK